MEEYQNIKIEEVIKRIRTFYNDENYNNFKSYYYSKSLLEIMGVSRKEFAHSNFLAWILNNKESHMLGHFSMKKFLELIVTYSIKFRKIYDRELYNSIIVSDYEIIDLKIETEKKISIDSRIDIYVELKINYLEKSKNIKIIVENKVLSSENSNQTSRYYKYFNDNKKDEDIIFYIYLTSLSMSSLDDLNKPKCSCKEFIQINYQLLADFILEPALKFDITQKTRFIIEDYLQSLSQLTIDKDMKDYKQGLIMALGSEERKLLTNFWNKNQKIIMAAMYAASSDPNQDVEVREEINDALNNVVKSSRNRSNCVIKFNDIIEGEPFIKADIGLSTVRLLIEKDLMDDKKFKLLSEDKTCGHHLIIKLDEILESEKIKYGTNIEQRINYKGNVYFIARNWELKTVNLFINKIQNNFTNIKFEIIN